MCVIEQVCLRAQSIQPIEGKHFRRSGSREICNALEMLPWPGQGPWIIMEELEIMGLLTLEQKKTAHGWSTG